MFALLTQSSPKQLKRFVLVTALMMMVNVFMTTTAFGRILLTTNDVVSVAFDNNRQLIVSGHTTCDAKETVIVRVTVTQRSTGALAEGDISLTATGEVQEFVVRARTLGKENFEEGPVTVVYLIHTSYRGDSTDCHQWLVSNLSLKKE